jgi:hypothetical protein
MMKKLVLVIMAKLAGDVQGSQEFIHLDRCLRFCMAKYLFMTAGPDAELEHQSNLHRTIDSFNDDSSLLHFRFKKREDLRRMLNLLQFPEEKLLPQQQLLPVLLVERVAFDPSQA